MAPFGPPDRPGPGRFPPTLGGYSTTPRVLSITPTLDVVAGGVAFTITGLQFSGSPTVLFGAQPATSIVVVSPTSITGVAPVASPATAQIVDVSVTVNGQTGTLANAFVYYISEITRITPAFGPLAGGTGVIIEGTNFVTGSAITFGGVAATSVTFIDAEHYAAITPARSTQGFVNVVIGAPTSATGTWAFKYASKARGSDIRR